MRTKKESKEGWIQLARELRREVYNPLDSVNNPSIRLLETYKSALRKAIEERIRSRYKKDKESQMYAGSLGALTMRQIFEVMDQLPRITEAMKTDNELIAEFMGWEFNEKPFNDWLVNGVSLGKPLQFDASWDWLMPVVEKIESIKKPKRCRWVTFSEMRDSVIEMPLYSKISDVYSSVVDFIKWYNQTKKP